MAAGGNGSGSAHEASSAPTLLPNKRALAQRARRLREKQQKISKPALDTARASKSTDMSVF